MKNLKKFIALYFNLSRKESNGFIILCLLMLLFIFFPFIGRTIFSAQQMPTIADQQSLNRLAALLDSQEIKSVDQSWGEIKKEKKIVYAFFDPNSSSEEEMTKAGVPGFISKRIVKFRSKGAVFRTKEDVKKIYGLSETTYQQLYAYIRLAQKTDNPTTFYSTKTDSRKKEILSFDLNKADSSQLVALKGIGPAFASRIVKYRNKLGGYLSIQQVKEVYGLDSTAFQEINSHGYVEQNFMPAKIKINSADENSMQIHPYIGKKIARMILSYRNQHGTFNSAEELKNIKSLTEENYSRILPYLAVE